MNSCRISKFCDSTCCWQHRMKMGGLVHDATPNSRDRVYISFLIRKQQPRAVLYRSYRRIPSLPIKMTSHKDTRSDVPTEQSTSYFNASYFPESSTYINNEVDFNDVFSHFDDGNIAAFATPASYDNLRRQTAAEKGTSSAQGLILGNSDALYQPYYPTNEEVPITAGLGTDLINWKLCSRNSSSYTGTRSQTSGQRTSRPSKNAQTPPTICETATIVNGGQAEFENEDIDLDKAAKENFDHLTRFNKQKSIMQHVDTTIQSKSFEQYPSLQSTKVFFPNWEIEAYHHTTPIDVGAIDNMGLHFEVDADSTVSKSQTQSSVFTGDHRRAAGTAPSVTSYTESSIADSTVSERFKSRMVPTNYTRYLEDDAFTYHSGYSGHESMSAAEYAQISMVPPNLQYAFDTALEQFNASLSPTQPMTSISQVGYPQQKRTASLSPSPQPPKRRLKRDHICPTCHANFTEKTNLTRHIKSRKCTQNGPDMFYCPVSGCTRFYEGRSDNLKAHMKRVHRKEWARLKTFQGDWKEKSSLAGHLYMPA
ncbi:uncharacterized protein DFL_005746 [Arthrobotrys flagrans]|uniref:C2H2-type domain-containing protein n=1 Tax=Arthrobotrys flagrans TaxID=97331 RepID=A0A436ZYC8_ARTFL|nr:hypothetical protein DFL_005746 [Arthrobotrys flagrans]